MSNYKKLEVNGTLFYYKRVWDDDPYSNEADTEFYTLEGKKQEIKWSWRKFRKVPTGNMVDNYVHQFTLYFDIEEPRRTKGFVRKKLEHKIELLGRPEEIKKGELI